MMWRRLAKPSCALLLAAAVGGSGGCSSSNTSESSGGTDGSDESSTTAPAPRPSLEAVLVACTPASPGAVIVIDAALTGTSSRGDPDHIGEAFVAAGDDDLRYLTANIYSATGERVSSADVWISDGTAWYALSTSAREYSALPDGHEVLGASARDPIPAALRECVVRAAVPSAGP
jgi:hypothetical protein